MTTNRNHNVLGTGMSASQFAILGGMAVLLVCVGSFAATLILSATAPISVNTPPPATAAPANPSAMSAAAFKAEAVRLISDIYGPTMQSLSAIIKETAADPSLVTDHDWQSRFALAVTALDYTAETLDDMSGPAACRTAENHLTTLAVNTHGFAEHIVPGMAQMDPDEVRLSTSYANKINSTLVAIQEEFDSGGCR